MPALRRAVRLRGPLPQITARALPLSGRAARAAAAHLARAVRRVKWLTPGGLVASVAVGAAVVCGLGLPGVVLLMTFFVTGSLLSQVSGESGGRRTARQVLAN